MQWAANYILLASIAVISAGLNADETRTKRDLAYIKNIVLSKVFGSDENIAISESPKEIVKEQQNYRLFRIPGFDKILVKAVPKVSNLTEVQNLSPQINDSAEMPPSIALISSYLGTNNLNDTLHALQGMMNLVDSGIFETIRGGNFDLKPENYPSVSVESGEYVVNKGGDSVLLSSVKNGYKPTENQRYPKLPIPIKYSYKQVNHGDVMTYTAKDSKNVVVTHTKTPSPLPPYLTRRFQEVILLAHPMPIPYGPTIKVPPLPVELISPPVRVPSNEYASSVGYTYGKPTQVQDVPTPPKVSYSHAPSGYSYSHIHSDGSVTTHTGSGNVAERKKEIPVVITETSRPAPLPVFISDRIEKVAATAMAAKFPEVVNDYICEVPVPIYEDPYPVIVEKRPSFVYDYVNYKPPHVINKPMHKEEVKVHTTKHKNGYPVSNTRIPTGYSYKAVHSDGTVDSYSNAGAIQKGNYELWQEMPMEYYPIQYPSVYDSIVPITGGEHKQVHSKTENMLKPEGGFSYKTVYGGIAQTNFDYGNTKHGTVDKPVQHTIKQLASTSSPTELKQQKFETNNGGLENIIVSGPVVSKYTYKQINHNMPDKFTVVNVGNVPIEEQGKVKVAAAPGLDAEPYKSIPEAPNVSMMGSIESATVPDDYVFLPPTDVSVPLPTKKTVVISQTEGKTGTANLQVNNNQKAVTLAPLIKIVKTSSSSPAVKTSTKSPKIKSDVKVYVSNSKPPVTSAPVTSPLSLSASPIVVLPEQTFSFKQDRTDGSSITVVGNNENSVSVIEKKTPGKTRGDIPEMSY